VLGKLVRRRADAQRRYHAVALGPSLRTRGVGTDGEIAIQADPHVACSFGRGRELPVREPLLPHYADHGFRIRRCERGNSG
jgi:hypothetical protein